MRSAKTVLLGIGVLCCFPAVARPQRLELDSQFEAPGKNAGYWANWDAIQERLVFHRDVDDPALPAVRVVDHLGKSLALYPGRDFSGSHHVDIWDAKGAPDGDIVISAIVAYGPRNRAPIPTKLLLLTYDSAGTLRRVWDVKPYHHHLITIDSAGDVFAFGHSDSTSGNVPLIVKYSPQGEVLKEFLRANLLPMGAGAVEAHSNTGETQMFVKDNRLILYIAPTQELFTFSLEGDLLTRMQLSTTFGRVAQLTESAAVQSFEFGIDSNQHIIAQVRLYPKDRAKPSSLALIRIAPDGSFVSATPPVAGKNDEHEFLGLTKTGAPVYLELSNKGSLMVDLNKHYELPWLKCI